MARDPAASVTQQEVIQAVVRAALREVHSTIPGVVTKYDPVLQRAEVKPVVRAPVVNELGDEVLEDHPVFPNVPVRFPTGAGFTIIFPLAVGDHVDLHFADEDPSGWRVTGQVSDPPVRARHGLFAYATPGARPDISPNSDGTQSTTRLVIGREGGNIQIRIDSTNIELGKAPSDWVALANLVNARISSLVNAFNTHVHEVAVAAPGTPSGPGGSAVTGPGSTIPVFPSPLASVASNVVKCT